jgi:integrase
MTALHVYSPPPGPPGPGPLRTVAELLAAFVEQARADGRYAAATVEQRGYIFARFLGAFGARPADSLRPAEIEDWLRGCLCWGPSTRRSAFNTLAAVWHWAVRRGTLSDDPFARLDRPTEGPRGKDMKPEEFRKLLRKARRDLRFILIFAARTGCRPGEWASACWRDVDWEKSCIVLAHHKTERKTGRPRRIPVTSRLYRLLRRLHAAAKDKNGLIFLTSHGTPWTKAHWVQTMARLCRRAAIRSLSWKSIRHMVGTQLVRAGRPIKLVSLALGHSSVTTTERVYLHLDDQVDAMREALE